MKERDRVKKDIEMFEKNLSRINIEGEKEKEILNLAESYYNDAKYYLEKGELFTAFGCINYAHGLLDAIIKLK